MKKYLLLTSLFFVLITNSKSQDRSLFGTNTLYESMFINPSRNHFSDSNTFMAFSILPFGGLNIGINMEYRGFAGRAVGAAIFKDEVMDMTPALNHLGRANTLTFNTSFDPFMLRFRVNKKYKAEVSVYSRLRQKLNLDLSNDFMTFLAVGNGPLLGKQLNGFFNTNSRAYAYSETGLGYRMNINDKLGVGLTASYLKVLTYKEVVVKNSNMFFQKDGDYFEMSANGAYYQAGIDVDTNGNLLYVNDSYKPHHNWGMGFSLGADYKVNNKLTVFASARELGVLFLNSNSKFTSLNKTLRFEGYPPFEDSTEQQRVIDNLKNFASDTVSNFKFQRALDPNINIGVNYAPIKWITLRGNIENFLLTQETQLTGSVDFRLKAMHLIFLSGASTNGYTQLGTQLLMRTQHTDFYIGMEQYGVATNKIFSPGININTGIAFRIGKHTEHEKKTRSDDKLRKKNKDQDLDGVPDAIDKCPLDKGPADNFGCPVIDRDKDGVLDSLDQCPDEFGPLENNGCPIIDRDLDGVLDSVDKCPDVFGYADNDGCPYGDKDGDGILDNVDECPDAFGDSLNKGCPPMDRDSDGVLDSLDECPDTYGPIGNKGCPYPDKDGDGVFDNIDKCPEIAGTAQNDGCPELKKVSLTTEDAALVKTAFKDLQFNSGKAVIATSSYTSLNNVVVVFIKNPSYKLILEGFTDNSGDPEKNRILSQERADAVKKYLVGKGIEASRITALGYGAIKPVADNDTAIGRAQNRRVEFTVVE